MRISELISIWGLKPVYDATLQTVEFHWDVSEQYLRNDPEFSAMIEYGADMTQDYPVKKTRTAAAIAGGAGNFAAATAITAVAGKRIFVRRVELELGSNTNALAGLNVSFKDGAGGSTLFSIKVNCSMLRQISKPMKATTAATLLEWEGTVGDFTALDDADDVVAHIHYREI